MMTHLPSTLAFRPIASLGVALLILLALPASALGHAELETADPADGTSVEASFAGPITLTFSEALEAESGAELYDSAGQVAATAAIDGAIITLTPEEVLAEGEYEIRWTAAADDGHIERGKVRFTVLPAATPEPTASPTPTPLATATPSAAATPSAVPASASPTSSAVPAASAAPVPSAGTDGDDASSDGDAILPIIAAVVIVGGLAGLLLRRRDSTSTPS